jgi:choline dehydrogenase-like flavoprotein
MAIDLKKTDVVIIGLGAVVRFGFSHEVPNLGIVGASVMGTSGAHNPTLTAQALAWRTAEHLAMNWNAIAKG